MRERAPSPSGASVDLKIQITRKICTRARSAAASILNSYGKRKNPRLDDKDTMFKQVRYLCIRYSRLSVQRGGLSADARRKIADQSDLEYCAADFREWTSSLADYEFAQKCGPQDPNIAFCDSGCFRGNFSPRY